MPRIIGIDIPDNKRLVISLTYIYGIGNKYAQDIVLALSLDPNMRAGQLSQGDIARLNQHLQTEYTLGGELKRKVQSDIKRLISINAYRGSCHRKGIPVRGQRTRTNARTRKGRKKTVAGKKK